METILHVNSQWELELYLVWDFKQGLLYQSRGVGQGGKCGEGGSKGEGSYMYKLNGWFMLRL